MVSSRMLCGLVLLAVCHQPTVASCQEEGDRVFDTVRAEQFGDASRALAQFVKAQKRPGTVRDNHFCVIGYESKDGSRRAYIRWQEGMRIIVWDGSSEPQGILNSILNPRRVIDLKTDMVKDLEPGSTYQVTVQWVNRLTADCAKFGREYTIKN